MTLVVGCTTSNIGFLVADTLLSFPFELKGHKGPVNGQFHALKIHILDPFIAVAFAGDVAPAFRLIRELHLKLINDRTIDPCEQLFTSYKQAIGATGDDPEPDCEFLVLLLAAEGTRLAKITRDGVSYRDRAYIGDVAEYERMQRLRRPYAAPTTRVVQHSDGTFSVEPFTPEPGEAEFAEVSDAMEELATKLQCVDRRYKSSVGAIGGNVTRVVTARISGELEYLQTKEASFSPWEGASGFSLLASNTGTRGIGIYYRSGKIGFVFVVGDDEPCHKEAADTEAAFIETIRSKYGLSLE